MSYLYRKWRHTAKEINCLIRVATIQVLPCPFGGWVYDKIVSYKEVIHVAYRDHAVVFLVYVGFHIPYRSLDVGTCIILANALDDIIPDNEAKQVGEILHSINDLGISVI